LSCSITVADMVDPLLEMRRLAGKFALFLAGCYALVLGSMIIGVFIGGPIPLFEWFLMPIPAAAFVPAVMDAVKLHRTTEPDRLKMLWRRSLGFAVVGTAVLFAIAFLIARFNSR
jgi:hypothetical protein